MLYSMIFTITLLAGPNTGWYETWELSFSTLWECESFEADLMQAMVDFEIPTQLSTTGCEMINTQDL